MLKGEGAEHAQSLCAKGPSEESSPRGESRGVGTREAPHVETRQQKPQSPFAPGPPPRGRDVTRDVPAPGLIVCVNWPGDRQSERCLFLPDCLWNRARSVPQPAPQPQSGRNELHMFTLPALARTHSMPGKMLAPLPVCGTVGGGCTEPGKGVPPDHTLGDLDPRTTSGPRVGV